MNAVNQRKDICFVAQATTQSPEREIGAIIEDVANKAPAVC